MLVFLLACSGPIKETGEPNDFAYDWNELDYGVAGPYQVGHIQVEHQYIPLSDQPERTIVIDIWYPTEETSGSVGEYLYGVDDLVFEDAVPAAPIYQQGYPVHIHSHGYQGWGASSSFLMRHFASHGWVAVAPNHTNNLLGDHQSPLPLSHFVHRIMDIKESLDVLVDVDLNGVVNTEAVVMSGHSFGASYTTWGISGSSYDNIDAFCNEGVGPEDPSMRCTDSEYEALSSSMMSDPRVSVAIPMAGKIREVFFGAEGYKQVHAPVLFVSGTEDGQEQNQEEYDSISEIDYRWLSLSGGCHQTFATGACDTLEMQLGFDIQNAYILAFARWKLLNDSNENIVQLLQGEVSPWQEATVLVK
jgi:predicted dienelactone hydrolase